MLAFPQDGQILLLMSVKHKTAFKNFPRNQLGTDSFTLLSGHDTGRRCRTELLLAVDSIWAPKGD